MAEERNMGVILAVDDTPENLALLDSTLGSAGYKVLTMPRGDLALRAAKQYPPDLILLDINMPGMNGYDVCRALKNDDELKDIPVLFISAYTAVDEKVEAFRAGGVDYVSKPFQEEELHARVRTHIKLRKQTQKIERNYQKLVELNGLRDNLIQMIVHDLRSPLTAINGAMDVLLMSQVEQLPEKSRKLVSTAKSSTSRMVEMVSSLLDLNRLEAGEFPLTRESFSIHDLIEDSLNLYRETLRNIRFTTQIDITDELMVADRHLIRRVLINLLGNAVKFTPAGEVIAIELNESAEQYEFSVIDQGPGVPDEAKELIFQKYWQATRAGNSYSSGIGLAFCKLAVEAHGGQIGVESDLQLGSKFYFTIPKGAAKLHEEES